MWSISGSKKYLSGGSGTTPVSPASTAPNLSTRRGAWTATCACTWVSHHLSAACVARSIPGKISWSITSASTQVTNPSTVTFVAKASPSRPSWISTFAKTTLAVYPWRGLIASPLKQLSRLEDKLRKSHLLKKRQLLLGKLPRALCPPLGQIETLRGRGQTLFPFGPSAASIRALGWYLDLQNATSLDRKMRPRCCQTRGWATYTEALEALPLLLPTSSFGK